MKKKRTGRRIVFVLGALAIFLSASSARADYTVIGTSTSASATGFSGQRKAFYANSYYWAFYSDGTNMVYRTSSDGETWSGTTGVGAATDGRYFALWNDGTTVYYVREDGDYDVVANRGTISGNSITWGSETTVFDGSGASDDYTSKEGVVNITKDSNGKLWASTVYYDGSTRYVRVRRSTNADDTSAWDSETTVFSNANDLRGPTMVPLPSGQIYLVWYRLAGGGGAWWEGKLYNGTGWDASATTIGDAGAWGGYTDMTTAMVVDGDNKLHIVYGEDSTDRLTYKNLTSPYGSSNWSSAVEIAEDTAYDSLGFGLTLNSTDDSMTLFGPRYLYCGGAPRFNMYRRYENGWFVSEAKEDKTFRVTGAVRLDPSERIFHQGFCYDADAGTPFEDITADLIDCAGDDVLHSVSGALIDLNTSDYFYVGLTEPFKTIVFNSATAATGGSPVLRVEYSQGSGSWGTLTSGSHGLVDNTSGFTTMDQDIRWTTNPSDWVPDSVNSSDNLYWIRIRYSTAPTTSAPIGGEIAPIRQGVYCNANYSDSSRAFAIWTDSDSSSSAYNISFFTTTSLTHSERLSYAFTESASQEYTTGLNLQRKVFYDGSTYFAFFMGNALGGNDWSIFYKASTDGTNWNDPPTEEGSAGTNWRPGFSVWHTGSTVYCVYFGNTYDILVQKGTISGASISWDAAQTVFDGTSSSDTYSYPYISRDSNGRLWVVTRYYDGVNYRIRARRSTNVDDVTAWDASSDLGDASDVGYFSAGEIAGLIVPLTSAQMYAVWYRAGTYRGELYNGSWSSSTLTTIGTASVTDWVASYGPTAVVDNDNTVHVVYSDSSDYLQHKTCTSPYGSSDWSSAAAVDGTQTGSTEYSLSLNSANNTLSLFFAREWASGSRKAAFKRYSHLGWSTNAKDIANHTWEKAFDQVWVYDASAATKYGDETSDAADTATADVVHSTSGSLLGARGDYLYVGLDEQFDGVFFSLSTATSDNGGITVEYSQGSGNWGTLPRRDGTDSLTTTGSPVMFEVPVDWTTDSVNGSSSYYWVRFGWAVAPTTLPVGSTVSPVMYDEYLTSNYSGSEKAFVVWQERDYYGKTAAMFKINVYDVPARDLRNPPTNQLLMRHGKWFYNGEEQPFWWAEEEY